MDIVEAEGRRIAQRQYERFARGELRAQDSGGLGSPSLLCVSTQVHPPMLNLRSLLASRGSPRGRSARSGSTAGSPEAEGSSAEGASAVEREREAPHGAAKLRTNVDAGLESALPWSESFVLEVPDNFSRGTFLNLPIRDLARVVQNALEQGYTVAWDADVSEKGFSFRNGMALMPAEGSEPPGPAPE